MLVRDIHVGALDKVWDLECRLDDKAKQKLGEIGVGKAAELLDTVLGKGTKVKNESRYIEKMINVELKNMQGDGVESEGGTVPEPGLVFHSRKEAQLIHGDRGNWWREAAEDDDDYFEVLPDQGTGHIEVEHSPEQVEALEEAWGDGDDAGGRTNEDGACDDCGEAIWTGGHEEDGNCDYYNEDEPGYEEQEGDYEGYYDEWWE